MKKTAVSGFPDSMHGDDENCSQPRVAALQIYK